MLKLMTKHRQPEIPAAHRTLKILKGTSYAREDVTPGAVVVVDRELAEQWLREGIAEETTELMPLWPMCPRCGTRFAVSPALEPGRWIACPTPRCGGGWHR